MWWHQCGIKDHIHSSQLPLQHDTFVLYVEFFFAWGNLDWWLGLLLLMPAAWFSFYRWASFKLWKLHLINCKASCKLLSCHDFSVWYILSPFQNNVSPLSSKQEAPSLCFICWFFLVCVGWLWPISWHEGLLFNANSFVVVFYILALMHGVSLTTPWPQSHLLLLAQGSTNCSFPPLVGVFYSLYGLVFVLLRGSSFHGMASWFCWCFKNMDLWVLLPYLAWTPLALQHPLATLLCWWLAKPFQIL